MIYQGKARYPVKTIVVHCSATRPSWMKNNTLEEKIAEIRRWHVEERGWAREGYHWFIDRDGRVLPGRPETMIGSHVMGKNAGSLGLCLIGGHGSSADDEFEANFTAAQDYELRELIESIKRRTTITGLFGHNDFAKKACPGFNVSDWWFK